LLSKANKGDLIVRLSHSDREELSGHFTSTTRTMMFVILTVTLAVAALFFEMIHQRLLAIGSAAFSIALGILSVLKLLRR